MSQNWWKIPGKNGEIRLTTQDLVEFSELYVIRLARQFPDIPYNRTYNLVLHHLKLDKTTFSYYHYFKGLYKHVIELSKQTSTWIIE